MEKTKLCGTCKYAACTFVPSQLVANPDIVIIGEAPGAEEERSGIPFVGASGRMLRNTFTSTGFDMSKITIMNTVRCRPPENEQPGKKAIAACTQQFLFNELQAANPKRIVCAGAVAASVFPGDTWQGIPVTKIYHPAALLYDPAKEPKFKQDIRKLYNTMYPKAQARELIVIDTMDGIEIVRTWIADKNIVACDIETNGTLDPFALHARILCVAFGDSKIGYSISLDKDNDPVFTERAAEFVKEMLRDESKMYIFHRCWFDVKFLQSRGFEVKKYTDTRLMSFLLNENRKEHGLKELTSEFIGPYEYQMEAKNRHEFGLYNAEDVVNTHKLYEMFAGQMTSSLNKVLSRIILPAMPVINEMMLTGMRIDQNVAKELKKELQKDRDDAYNELLSKYRVFRGINLASPDQMQAVIFGALKKEPVKKTKTGFSVDEETLNTYAYEGEEWARLIVRMRKQEKLLSTYVEKIPGMVNADGRIRTQFDPMGTVTGRYCVAGDTLLETTCGTFKISELDLTKHTECAILTHKNRNRKILRKIIKGTEAMYEVELKNGSKIRCTQEHRFLTLGGWKSLWEIRIGQPVCTTGGSGRQENGGTVADIQRGEFCETVPRNGVAGQGDSGTVSCELPHSGKLQDVLQGEVQGRPAKDKEHALRREGVREHKRGTTAAGCSYSEKGSRADAGGGQGNVDNRNRVEDERILCQNEHGAVRTRGAVQTAAKDASRMGNFERAGTVQPRHNRSGKGILSEPEKVLRGNLRGVLKSVSAGMVSSRPRIVVQQDAREQDLGKEPYMLEYQQRRDTVGTWADARKDTACAVLCAGREQDSGLCVSEYENTRRGGRIVPQHARAAEDGQREEQNSKEERVSSATDTSGHDRTKPAESDIHYQTSPIKSVKYIGIESVWDIEVEEDHSYAAQGFINHNSSKDPNLQNIPRDNRIYKMFVAEEGKQLIYFDFAALELRVACSIAYERKMIQAFNDKVDLHVRTATFITGKKPEDITKEERQLAKGTSFGLLYGQQAEGLKRYLFDKFNIDIKLEEAERIREVFFEAYNGLPLWHNRVADYVRNNYQVEYPTGRLRRFPQVKALNKLPGEVFRQAVNSPVQGSGNDVVVFSTFNLYRLVKKRKLPLKFVLTVHDSVIMEADDDAGIVDEVKDIMDVVLQEVVPNDDLFRWLKVPLAVEWKTGRSWGDLK